VTRQFQANAKKTWARSVGFGQGLFGKSIRYVFSPRGAVASRCGAAEIEGCKQMHALKPDERRGAQRYPLERLAKIQLGIGTAPYYCLVVDISDGGVRLNLNGREVPDEFVLLISGDGPARDGTYRVVWRLGQEIGAKLVSDV
jgi:hypothetical protein